MCWVYLSKKENFFYASLPAGHGTFERKSTPNASGLSYATFPTFQLTKYSNHQLAPIETSGRMKSMPSPTHRLSIAVFLAVAGYSPIRTIQVRSRLQ